MGLSYLPIYRVTANDKDITAIIAERFSSLSITDETGFNSDTLEIVLTDHIESNPVKVPPTGAELEVSLGYEGELVRKGLFVCDEVELAGWPGTMTLRGRAAPYEGTPKGKTDLQTQKSRSWPANTTIGAMVKRIAGEHGMADATSAELASIKLPHIDQSQESDMNLLVRLAKRYDAIAKPAGGKLIFAKRGDSKSVSGASLAKVTIRPPDVGRFSVTTTRRDSPGTVVAYYRDNRAAKRHEVSAGKGDPVKRLRQGFKNADMAKAAVEAELNRRARGETRLTLDMVGDPNLTAEATLNLEGFREGVAGEWLVTRVTHTLSRRGYTCSVEAEKPNSDPDVQEATEGDVSDIESPKAEEVS